MSLVWYKPLLCLFWTQLVSAVSERAQMDKGILKRVRKERVKEGQTERSKTRSRKRGPNIRKILAQHAGSTEADAIKSYDRHRPVCQRSKMTRVLLLESCICNSDQRATPPPSIMPWHDSRGKTTVSWSGAEVRSPFAAATFNRYNVVE